MAGEWVLVFSDGKSIDYTQIVSLNDTAKFLIGDDLNREFTAQEWTEKLVQEYEITPETAERDVLALIQKLEEAQLLA